MNIYGIHAVMQFLKTNPERSKQLCVQKGRADDRIQEILYVAQEYKTPTTYHSREKLDEFAKNEHHQGVVLTIAPTQLGDERSFKTFCENLSDNAIILVFDGIKDPHNLGACLRSAAAFNVNAVVWPKDKQASITPLARKVASGAVDMLNLFAVTNLVRSLEHMKEAGVWLVGTVLNEEAQPLQSINLNGNVAIIVGSEEEGLRQQTQRTCDHLAYIPMPGMIQSLNVSVATGIALYEVQRQRS